jgi:hypothetical protein
VKWGRRALTIVIALIILAIFSTGFSTYDYSLKCTRCLQEYQVVEYQFCGGTYHSKKHLVFERYDMNEILGAPCEHVYRTGGFGREAVGMISDGETAEGNFFRPRWEVIETAFALNKQFPNKELLRRTLTITDKMFPPDALMKDKAVIYKENGDVFTSLWANLAQAKTAEAWERAVSDAETEFSKEGSR